MADRFPRDDPCRCFAYVEDLVCACPSRDLLRREFQPVHPGSDCLVALLVLPLPERYRPGQVISDAPRTSNFAGPVGLVLPLAALGDQVNGARHQALPPTGGDPLDRFCLA